MDVTDMKHQYNKLLEREQRAEKYLNDDSIPYGERLRWSEKFEEILNQMSDLLEKIGPCTQEERLSGFKDLGGVI